MNNRYLLNQIDKIEILLGELYSGLSKYPTINLKNYIIEIIYDMRAISNTISNNAQDFDIRNVKKLEAIYNQIVSKIELNNNVIKTGHNLAILCYKIANLIIDVCIELDKTNVEKNSEIHEYLNILNKYFNLCGNYINESFGINDLYYK